MAFNDSEAERFRILTEQVVNRLQKESLIGSTYRIANRGHLSGEGFEVPENGFVLNPAIMGIELYLWAHGKPNCSVRDLLSDQLEFETVQDIPQVDRYVAYHKDGAIPVGYSEENLDRN